MDFRFRLQVKFNQIAKIASGVVITGGVLVIIGWVLNIDALKSIHPRLVAMKANTAFSFILLGISLWLQASSRPGSNSVRLERICSFLVLLIASLTLCEYMAGWNLPIDGLIFKEAVGAVRTSSPGRMAPSSAFNFVILSSVTLLMTVKNVKRGWSIQLLTLLVLFLSQGEFISYCYEASGHGQVLERAPMALHAAILFMLTSVGILYLSTERGFMRVVASEGNGGVLARRLMPAALCLPIVLDFLKHLGADTRLYSENFGSALYTLMVTIIAFTLVMVTSFKLHKIDRLRADNEAALAESEKRFLDIFYASKDALLLIDGQIFVDCNLAASQMLKYPDKNDLLKIHPSVISPSKQPDGRSSLDKADEMISMALQKGYHRFEWLHKRSDEENVLVEVSLTPISFKGKRMMYCHWRDLTENKVTEEKLKLLSFAVEQSPATVLITDTKGSIEYVNPQFERVSGYSRQEVIGKNPRILKSGHTSAEEYKKLWETIARGEIWKGEFHNKNKNGQLYWESAVIGPIRNSTGKIIQYLAVKEDITQRKKIEYELGRSIERFELAVRGADGGIWDWDIKDQLYFSPRMNSLLGFEDDPLPNTFTEFTSRLHPDDLSRVWAAIEAHLKERTPYKIQFRLKHRSGEHLWFESRGQAMWDPKTGEATRMAGSVIDITQQRQMEGQLAQAKKMEAVGQLAGGIAHDFNNILTVINGYSEILLSTGTAQDPSYASITEIQKAGQRAAGLTKQLLAFSRKQIITPRTVGLNELLNSIVGMLKRLIGEHIEIELRPQKDLGLIHVDPTQIEQVIVNLAVNAGDAMPDGGHLIIETANITLGEEYVKQHSHARAGAFIMLSVTDNGCGMTPAIKDRIFEPFFTTKEKGKGTGLGLATCYGIVKQNGGSIEVYSEPKQGTVFKIYFPRSDKPAETVPLKPSVIAHATGTETILVVEDEEALRNFAALVLRERGFNVITAADGEEAFRFIQSQEGKQVTLVLTDVVMPKMGGRELYEKLKPSYPHLKVLFVSGYTEEVLIRNEIQDQKVNFLQKPYSADALAGKVRELLDQ